MIATTSHTKTCSNCWARKSIDEYRFVSREKGTRRSHCRDCRRTIEQTQKTKKSRRVFVNGLREIRRSSTTKRIHNLIEGLAAEVGGISVVFEMFTALLTPVDIESAAALTALVRLLGHRMVHTCGEQFTTVRAVDLRGASDGSREAEFICRPSSTISHAVSWRGRFRNRSTRLPPPDC